jgi:hypothetical protein
MKPITADIDELPWRRKPAGIVNHAYRLIDDTCDRKRERSETHKG